MALTIRLLGTPGIDGDAGGASPVRGRKAWGLLTYLLMSDRPVPRERIVDLLFTDADDPLGALRWNLSQLRRSMGEGVKIGGDPVRLVLPQGTTVDALQVTRGTWIEAVDLSGLGQPLLAGMSFDASPAFQFWLDAERRRLQAAGEAVLQDAARARLAQGEAALAVADATRLVELNPLDENAHVLLILALRAAGEHGEAAAQARACTKLLQRELGVEPGPALAAALDTPSLGASSPASSAAVAVRIEAGESAVAAGALAAGLDTLRRAAWDARAVRD